MKNKILIVDDEADIIEFLSYNFRKRGYIVEFASNGIQGIDKVSSFSPDLIISDVLMPDMDGITMCKVLKSLEFSKNIPLIFLSAAQEDVHVINAGMIADEYISKPIRIPFLMKIVENILSKE